MEMDSIELIEISGGGVVRFVSNFLSNKLIWTNANIVYNKIFKPANEQLSGKVTS